MSYVDGFVLPVSRKKLRSYRSLSEKAGRIWREHGALQYVEAVGDDVKVKCGIPFPRRVKPKPGEAILFSWIVFKSRAHRDRVNAKVMKDQRMRRMMEGVPMPFDVKRMSYGGFKYLVDV